METVVLSDVLGGLNSPGRRTIRALTNAKPIGVMPLLSEFAANQRPPKLNYEASKFANSNPVPQTGLSNSQQSSRDPNAKMKEFKERLKLSKSGADPEKVKSTGLFSFTDFSTKKGKEKLAVRNSEESAYMDVNHPTKSQPNSILRNRNKIESLDVDIHQRINKAFHSIESLGKDFATFDKTLKAATERAVADGKLNRKVVTNSTQSLGVVEVKSNIKSRPRANKPTGVMDVTRPVVKVFGFDASAVLNSSGSGGETDETDFRTADSILKKVSSIGPKPSRKKRTKSTKYKTNLTSRSPSPEIALIRDKRFLARHEKQGSVLNKDIADMRNQLEVMEKRTDRESRKSNVTLKKSNFQRPNNITRLMAFNPNKGTGRELTDFLQSNGGICGGWDPDDHNIFLQTYFKWKSRPSRIVDLLKKELGDKTVEEIAAHISWYEKYENLNKANKAYIRQWQVAKRREKDEIYRLAKEEQMSKLEADKRKNDSVRAQRQEERERNRMKLDEWKSSIALERKMIRINADLIREPDNESRIGKLQEAMENIKKGFSNMQPKHPDVRKYLTSKKVLRNTTNVEGDDNTGSSGFSDGDSNDDNKSEFTGLGAALIKSENSVGTLRYKLSMATSVDETLKKSSSQALRKLYQSRDARMVETRRQAVKLKLAENTNKLLTSTEIKERIKKMDVRSKFMNTTQGWTNRLDARDAEKMEATSRLLAKRKNNPEKHNASRVRTAEMFQTGSSVELIPKLGTPGWRK